MSSSGCGASKITALWSDIITFFFLYSFHASAHLKVNIRSCQHSLRGRWRKRCPVERLRRTPSSSACSAESELCSNAPFWEERLQTDYQRRWAEIQTCDLETGKSLVQIMPSWEKLSGEIGHFLHIFVFHISERFTVSEWHLIPTSAERLSGQQFEDGCPGQFMRTFVHNSVAPLLL